MVFKCWWMTAIGRKSLADWKIGPVGTNRGKVYGRGLKSRIISSGGWKLGKDRTLLAKHTRMLTSSLFQWLFLQLWTLISSRRDRLTFKYNQKQRTQAEASGCSKQTMVKGWAHLTQQLYPSPGGWIRGKGNICFCHTTLHTEGFKHTWKDKPLFLPVVTIQSQQVQ